MPTECQHSYQKSFLFLVPLTFHSITLAVSDCLFKIVLLNCLFKIVLLNCLFKIVLLNCLFPIPKSVVFRQFHIRPSLTESIKLPQDHLVWFVLSKYIWYE